MARHHHSPQQTLSGIVSPDGVVSAALQELFSLHGIEDGDLVDLVAAADGKWQIRASPGEPPLKRDQINWPKVDDDRVGVNVTHWPFRMLRRGGLADRVTRQSFRLLRRLGLSDPVTHQSFRLLRQLGLVDRNFTASRQRYDEVICFGSYLPGLLHARHRLVQAWLGGLRFEEMFALGTPRFVSVALLQKLEAAYLRMPGVNAPGYTREPFTVGVKAYVNENRFWTWWASLPMPPDMRDMLTTLNVVSPDVKLGAEGDDLSPSAPEALKQFKHIPDTDIGGRTLLAVTTEPLAMYHLQAIRSMFEEEGFAPEAIPNIDLISGPEPGKRRRSLSMYLRQLSSLLNMLIAPQKRRPRRR